MELKIAPHLSRTCVLTRKPSRAPRFDHAGLTFSDGLAAVGPPAVHVRGWVVPPGVFWCGEVNFESLELKIAPHLSRTCVLARKPSRALRFDHAGLTFSHRVAAVGPTNRTCTGVGSPPRCILVL